MEDQSDATALLESLVEETEVVPEAEEASAEVIEEEAEAEASDNTKKDLLTLATLSSNSN